MRKLIIVGAGGFGRELYSWALSVPAVDRDWELYGFIDDNPSALGGFTYPHPQLGAVSDWNPQPNECFVLAIGNPQIKLKVAESLAKRDAVFVSVIHPSVVKGQNVRIGRGCAIGPLCMLTCDLTIGDFVTITGMSNVAHDASVGDGSTVCGHVDISGGVQVGKGVFVGSHSSLVRACRVEDFAVVGAGSVVMKKVRSGTTVFGVPAKDIGNLTKGVES